MPLVFQNSFNFSVIFYFFQKFRIPFFLPILEEENDDGDDEDINDDVEN